MKRLLIISFLILVFIIALGVVSYSYCYNHYQFWTHVKTDHFQSLKEYKGDRIKGLRGQQILIHRDFEPYLSRIDQYAANHNIDLIVNSSYRTSEQPLDRIIVNPSKRSNHIAGFAIDFNIKYDGEKYFAHHLKRSNLNELPPHVKNFIMEISNDKDLRWGGNFRIEDPVHIDFPVNLKSMDDWEEFSRSCSTDYSGRVPKWKIWK